MINQDDERVEVVNDFFGNPGLVWTPHVFRTHERPRRKVEHRGVWDPLSADSQNLSSGLITALGYRTSFLSE